MSDDDKLQRDWLLIEKIVGDSGAELHDVDDGAPELAPHEPSEAELDELAAALTPSQLAEQRAAVDALIREESERARVVKPARTAAKRAPLPPSLSRVELLAMVDQLRTAHPGQYAQHYRNLDGMTDETLRALVEDMLALAGDDEA